MKCLPLFVLSLLCVGLFAGCGSSSESPDEPQGRAVETTDSENEHKESVVETTAANAATTSAPEVRVAQMEPAKSSPPTAEQIAKWTPAPFEPVELLGIYEWEKTSFTSRIAAAPDGKHFIAAGSRVILWSLDDAKTPAHVFLELTSEDGDRHQQSLAIAPDGKWFVAGDSQGKLRMWDLADRKEIVTKQLYSNGIQEVAISPDGQEIATISYDREITIWSVPGLEEKKKFKPDVNFMKRLEYVEPQVLAAAGETTSTWNTATGKLVEELSPGRYADALGRSPDGEKFIFGADEALVIWNIKEGKREAELKQGISGREQVAFSPDGKYLATNNGQTIQLWNLAERRVTQVIDGFGWPIVGISWLPQSNLLVVASDIGLTRIWGTPEQGNAVGLKPLHGKLTKINGPAIPAAMVEAIDLRVLPLMPDSEVSLLQSGNLSCIVPAPPAEVRTFYGYFLERAGWKESEKPVVNPAAKEFYKDGFRLVASFYEADGKTNFLLDNQGNYDLTWIPKFDSAPTEITYQSPDTVSYTTKADVVQIETALLRALHKAGWTGYSRLHTSHSERPDARDLDFLFNGNSLHVSIGKFPNNPESYTVQYSLFPNNASVPIPPDAGYVEFDGSTEPTLIATTEMSLAEAREFYDKAMAQEGWLIRGKGHTEKDEYSYLSYLREECDVMIGLTKLEDGRTLVQVGGTNGSLWEGSLPVKKEESEEETEVVGIEAADFPVLNESQTAKYDTVEKTIEVVIENSTLAAAADKYTKAIEALGWKHDGRGIRDEQYTFLTYEKGDEDFSLRAHSKDGNALVNFGGDGLLWTKSLPGGKEVVSFERWLRLNKLPPDLGLLDRYEAEMRAIGAP